ncbi:hypothetical protein PF008_g4964 [Phytophthora fragariae]|uniref:Uncharacterized protein n=1 Tax=Phytophthora fragariae TaxID=53985 RepID=A0A6G0S9Q1_9STRA|nr:hypothetical protein PF008_g4964 [Phytophthora fragariae]
MLTIGRSRQSKLGSGLAAPHCHLSPGQPSVIFYPSVMPAAAAATVYGSKEAVTDGRGRAPDTRWLRYQIAVQ